MEFSDYEGLEKSIYDETEKRTNIYYCHPYRSCERGTNERINRDIRRQVPKGTDFTKYSDNVGYSRGILRVGSLVPTRFSFPYAILIRFNLRRIAAN